MAVPRCTLDQLAVLDAIEATGSFAGAARALHRVPSAVSYTVAALEDALGVALFDRSAHRARLTPAGRRLLEEARDVLRRTRQLETPARLVQLDKDDARTLDVLRLTGFPDPSDLDTFAFATWSGSFWLFVRVSGMGESTDVYEVTADGTMHKVLEDVGFDVVGAGVSTCAPS